MHGWGVHGWGVHGWGVHGWGVHGWGVHGWGVYGWVARTCLLSAGDVIVDILGKNLVLLKVVIGN